MILINGPLRGSDIQTVLGYYLVDLRNPPPGYSNRHRYNYGGYGQCDTSHQTAPWLSSRWGDVPNSRAHEAYNVPQTQPYGTHLQLRDDDHHFYEGRRNPAHIARRGEYKTEGHSPHTEIRPAFSSRILRPAPAKHVNSLIANGAYRRQG